MSVRLPVQHVRRGTKTTWMMTSRRTMSIWRTLVTRTTKVNCRVVVRDRAAKALHAVRGVDAVNEIANHALRNRLNGHVASQRGNLDHLRQETRLPVVAVHDLPASLQNFRIFRPGKKQSAVWQFARPLKNMLGEPKVVADVTVDALHAGEVDFRPDFVECRIFRETR